jgi:hypothetical protein
LAHNRHAAGHDLQLFNCKGGSIRHWRNAVMTSHAFMVRIVAARSARHARSRLAAQITARSSTPAIRRQRHNRSRTRHLRSATGRRHGGSARGTGRATAVIHHESRLVQAQRSTMVRPADR